MAERIRVEHLVKVFGRSPQVALNLHAAGATKEEILRQTGQVVALNDVSFTVGEGEVFVVMGLSGSGKSTLVRCINRLITVTSGHVYLDGEDIMAADEKRIRHLRRTKVSMVFQHVALFPHKTVLANVAYGLKVRGVPRREHCEKALAALQLVSLEAWAQRHPEELSGGMSQRVGLARALATAADILLMDEPFSALDPLFRRQMQDELLVLQRAVRKTIVFITHDLHEALKVGDRVAIMKDGRFVQVGTPEQIVSSPADAYVASFTRDVDRGRFVHVASVMRPAEALVLGADGQRIALLRLRELGCTALYLVDTQGRPVGLVVQNDLTRAMQEERKDLEPIIRSDFPQAPPSATLADVYHLCATGLPIAVVNDAGCLQGVLYQADILVDLAMPVEHRSREGHRSAEMGVGITP